MARIQTLFPHNFVSLILNGSIRIEHVAAVLEEALSGLGGQSVIEGGEIWTIPYQGDEHLAKLLDQLNRLGVLFVDQPAGWPPAAIFRDLRKKGLLHGSFRRVSWKGPGKWLVRKG
jgi:hypothetical protein